MAKNACGSEIAAMKPPYTQESQQPGPSVSQRIKRAVRRPRKVAPAPETLRGWAKSAARSRSKS